MEKALLAADVQLETFGGDVPVVHVSGLTGEGLPQLVETISLVAEMKDLRAEDTGPAQGYILESKVSKGLGYVCTLFYINCHTHSSPVPWRRSFFCVAPSRQARTSSAVQHKGAFV